MKYLLVILLIIVNFPDHSAAGTDFIGNGGDVIFCESGSPFLIQVLEEAEAKEYFAADPVENWKNNPTEAALFYLESLKRRQPLFAQKLEEQIKKFGDETRFLYGKELADIDDSKHQVVPAGCRIRQAIRLQLTPPKTPLGYPEKYIINGDLWNLLSTTQKAILILHEVLYEVYLIGSQKDKEKIAGWPNSTQSRYFNVLLFTKSLDRDLPTEKKLARFFHENYIRTFQKGPYEFSTFGLSLSDSYFYDNGRLRATLGDLF
ncbi:MAG: hypothetical protein AAF203_05710, partial [Pseudomonadota bacterium]